MQHEICYPSGAKFSQIVEIQPELRPDIQHTRGHCFNYYYCDFCVLCRMLIQLQHRLEKVLKKVKRFLVTMVASGRRYSDVWKTLSMQIQSLIQVLDAGFRTDVVFVLSYAQYCW